MSDFFILIRDFYVDIFDLFDKYSFTIGNYEVNYLSMIFVFIVIGFVVSIFWRGAKA